FTGLIAVLAVFNIEVFNSKIQIQNLSHKIGYEKIGAAGVSDGFWFSAMVVSSFTCQQLPALPGIE
ncbi:hypothetical protein NQ315_005345, partial [Exocentrus adspersus]